MKIKTENSKICTRSSSHGANTTSTQRWSLRESLIGLPFHNRYENPLVPDRISNKLYELTVSVDIPF
jgi:hypothetical protein